MAAVFCKIVKIDENSLVSVGSSLFCAWNHAQHATFLVLKRSNWPNFMHSDSENWRSQHGLDANQSPIFCAWYLQTLCHSQAGLKQVRVLFQHGLWFISKFKSFLMLQMNHVTRWIKLVSVDCRLHLGDSSNNFLLNFLRPFWTQHKPDSSMVSPTDYSSGVHVRSRVQTWDLLGNKSCGHLCQMWTTSILMLPPPHLLF